MYHDRVDDAGEVPSADELRSLQSAADAVADGVRVHLSGAFEVEAQVVTTPAGPTAAVSIHPPEAPPVAAGIPLTDLDDLSDDGRHELSVELVAAAVGRARDTLGNRFLPAAQ